MQRLNLRAFIGLAILVLVMVALLFGAAGTLHYWQGWAFLAVLFPRIDSDHSLSGETRSGTAGAADARRPVGREGADAEGDHVDRIGGIYRAARAARPRSSLWLVPRAGGGRDRRRSAHAAWMARHFPRLPGEQLHLLDHRACRRPTRDLDRAVRHRSSPDVCGGAPDAAGHSDF